MKQIEALLQTTTIFMDSRAGRELNNFSALLGRILHLIVYQNQSSVLSATWPETFVFSRGLYTEGRTVSSPRLVNVVTDLRKSWPPQPLQNPEYPFNPFHLSS